MKNRLLKLSRALNDSLDMPKEVTLDLPKIEITGNEEAVIENHKGILNFQNNSVVVKCKLGFITVKGINLEISYISDTTIIVSGTIQGISLGGEVNE